MKTRNAVVRQPRGPVKIELLDLKPPRAGEVLVKMAAAGIGRSDWQVCTGATPHPMPVALGHEGAGFVEAVGNGVTRFSLGDRVVLNWAPGCEECFYCARGKPGLCVGFGESIWAGVMKDGTPRLSAKGAPVYHYCGLACFSDYAARRMPACRSAAACPWPSAPSSDAA